MKKIVILGAGPTGLGAAYRLQTADYENWEIYEKNDYIGGLSASFRDGQGFTWDIGGHILFSNNSTFNRIADDILGDEVLTFNRESWIWLKNSFVRYPFQNNFHLHPNRELVLECVQGLFDLAGRKGSYSNFEEWILNFFGEGISKHFMIPYNKKVWACPLDSMDYNWIADRISVIDIRNIIRNIVYQSNDSSWGPNNTFRYPLHGGTGGFFQKFLTFTEGHLHKKKEVAKILNGTKEVIFEDGERTSYDVLITTIPLNELLGKMEDVPGTIAALVPEFRWSGGYIVGLGLNKPCPDNKNWIYFPQNDSPFYRVTYLSNYSPNMTPGKDYFSLLAETSFSKFKSVSRESIIDETIQGLINSGLLREDDRSLIISKYLIEVPFSYPVPFSGRDRILSDIQSFLSKQDIYSRGRFGAWKYEIGNMDHSVLQGIEIVERLLFSLDEKLHA
jgi:protoporphyrinogen oxidase